MISKYSFQPSLEMQLEWVKDNLHLYPDVETFNLLLKCNYCGQMAFRTLRENPFNLLLKCNTTFIVIVLPTGTSDFQPSLEMQHITYDYDGISAEIIFQPSLEMQPAST